MPKIRSNPLLDCLVIIWRDRVTDEGVNTLIYRPERLVRTYPDLEHTDPRAYPVQVFADGDTVGILEWLQTHEGSANSIGVTVRDAMHLFGWPLSEFYDCTPDYVGG